MPSDIYTFANSKYILIWKWPISSIIYQIQQGINEKSKQVNIK